MRQLEKSDIIGRKIVDIIVSTPDRPGSMSDQSYSAGFLRLDSGHLINLEDRAYPLFACDEIEIQKLTRDKETENEFRAAIEQKITGVTFGSEVEHGELRITTENDFIISFAPGLFWIRPTIESVKRLEGIKVTRKAKAEQRNTWWKFW